MVLGAAAASAAAALVLCRTVSLLEDSRNIVHGLVMSKIRMRQRVMGNFKRCRWSEAPDFEQRIGITL